MKLPAANRWTQQTLAATAFFLILAETAVATEVIWLTGSSITGVGEITQTYPPGPNQTNLHYGRDPFTMETASFSIDTQNARDYDVCSTDGVTGISMDAGLHQGSTDWTCTSSAGEVLDGSFHTVFIPNATVKSGITISCEVKEGHHYSYNDGNYDDPVEKTWAGSLTTFMVTVYGQPGNVVYTEEDPAPSQQFGQKGNAALSVGTIGWTGITSRPGATPATPLSGENQQDMSWVIKAETDSGAVGGIKGAMNFDPFIVCDGSLQIRVQHEGPDIGGVGNVAAAFAGAYNPYVGASVFFTTWVLGSGTHSNYAVAGESVIEYGSGSPPKINVVNSTGVGYSSINVDLGALSNFVSQATSLPSLTVSGSYDIVSQLQSHDDSATSQAKAEIEPGDNGNDWGIIFWGSTRPGYAPYQ